MGLYIISGAVYALVRFFSWLVMLLVVMFCGSFIGKGIATRITTADNNTSNANMNQMSLRATSFHLSFDVIIVSLSVVLTTLSLPRGLAERSSLWSVLVTLRGMWWRLSSEDERTIQDMVWSGGCVSSRKDEFVFTENSDEVLESHETMTSAGNGKRKAVMCLFLVCYV